MQMSKNDKFPNVQVNTGVNCDPKCRGLQVAISGDK